MTTPFFGQGSLNLRLLKVNPYESLSRPRSFVFGGSFRPNPLFRGGKGGQRSNKAGAFVQHLRTGLWHDPCLRFPPPSDGSFWIRVLPGAPYPLGFFSGEFRSGVQGCGLRIDGSGTWLQS